MEKEIRKLYYNSREVAQMYGWTVSHISQLCRTFEIETSTKQHGLMGRRQFTTADLLKLEAIAFLRKRGYPLKAIFKEIKMKGWPSEAELSKMKNDYDSMKRKWV